MKKRMLISNFNPRSHERSDKSERRINHGTINFNPRSHERSDGAIEDEMTYQEEISIHAPTRGATDYYYFKFN